ncbi:Hypothetical predicted protein [Paramuricea clavata]|uniref:Uncharacterized protein n=1 Tax=Paramuricea clavata TaxID=317549 RepID=A0A6S7GND8_PARCT|nr:Hypothetical predicted protein [Paramuricea clavata]
MARDNPWKLTTISELFVVHEQELGKGYHGLGGLTIPLSPASARYSFATLWRRLCDKAFGVSCSSVHSLSVKGKLVYKVLGINRSRQV